MKNIIVITGASSGFGSLASHALALAGHTVYAGMRETRGRNAPQVEEAHRFSKEHGVDLRTVEMDVSNQPSVDAAIKAIIEQQGHIDVLIHNAGHMVFGPAEAFTPEQLAELYDINVLSTQRVNRAVLPYLRKQRKGLVLWVTSSSSAGGTPPYASAIRAHRQQIVLTARPTWPSEQSVFRQRQPAGRTWANLARIRAPAELSAGCQMTRPFRR